MAFFKSEEDRAREADERRRAEQAALAAQQSALAAQQDEAARRAWQRSPQGQATVAFASGDRFFELQLEVGVQQREAMWGSRDYESAERTMSSAGVLAAIEDIGWTLEHVGYVFKMTGQSSSEKWLTSGSQTAVSGVTVGIYLFRRCQ